MVLKLNAQQQCRKLFEGPVLRACGRAAEKTRVATERTQTLWTAESIRIPYWRLPLPTKRQTKCAERLYARTPQAGRMTISTIHSMCALILRMDGEQLGYRRNFFNIFRQ